MIMRPRKALIIGAGIAGPVTAILLKRAGFEAAIYEGWSYSTGIGGGLQIAPNGMRVLAEIGLADELIRGGSVCESIDLYSQSGSRLGSVNRNMVVRFGYPSVSMRRAMLTEALVDQAWSSCVEVHFEKRLARIEDRPDQPIVAHFTDGSSAEGDVLIGADGVHSAVRRHVLPDGPTPCDTGLIGFGGFVPRAILEASGARSSLAMTFGQSGFFGYGFCGPEAADGAMCWSTQPARGIDAETFRAKDQATLKQHLRRFHAGWHDPIPQLIDATERIIVTATLDVATLPTWSRGRTLLIGDAAHATSPHAGQGASIALEDAYRLVRALQNEPEISIAFQNFESERRPRAERLVALARHNGGRKREFSRAGAWIRDQMIRVMLPLNARSQDWIYGYDARAVTPRSGMSSPRFRQAA
ncbi:FAD-dependent oxidoreductase [Bradyrhizobium sp.]|uniref:FAD-dependent oxidoreductase n=1 Tax=Bradyrhizobium sp. TaxID=376 RepID=UPI003C45EC6E